MKRCCMCKKDKPESEFCKDKSQKSGFNSRCKVCDCKCNKEYCQNNKEKERKRHEQNVKHRYGITLEQKLQILKDQNSQCAICGKQIKGKDAHVDHNHETKKIRGILCMQCNCMLGNANDNSSILANAIKYIDSSKGSVLTFGKTDAQA